MKKNLYEKIFGSWVIIAIVAILFAMVVYMKLTDEQFPDLVGPGNPSAVQQE